jgi:L-asparaginase
MDKASEGVRRVRVALISTGGTIEKTYDEFEGVLSNHVSVLEIMISKLKLGGVELHRVPLMNKDSLDMTPEDHGLIASTTAEKAREYEAVIIVHGTDRLASTGHLIHEQNPDPGIPIILTGAMRPYVMRTTDALQNLTEAFLAAQLAQPGVYVAMHNKLLRFPGVVKDREHGTFCMGD